MLKGVNKSVIEIRCTDSGYFEKAILFVNPEHSHISQKRLRSEAEKYVDMIKLGIKTEAVPKKSPVKKKAKGRSTLVIAIISASAALFAVAIYLFFNRM